MPSKRAADARGRERPDEELVIELDGLALPSRVARAARMFADALEQLGGDAGKVTMVVSNRTMRASLRGWEGVGAERVRMMLRLVENPLAAVQEAPELRPAARALATGAAELASVGGRFRRKRKSVARLDEAFANVMAAAAQEPAPPPRTIEGTTEVYTSVLRVGRAREASAVQARLLVAGAPRDVDVDERYADAYFDAAKRGGLNRVRLRARWYLVEDEAPLIDVRTAVAMSIEPWDPISGAQAIRELGELFSAADAAAILDGLGGHDA